MRTTAVYGASDSHVWLQQMLDRNLRFDPLSQDNMCYCSFQGEFPNLPRGLLLLKNPKNDERRPSESENESEVKVKPAFVFHPLRA